MNTSGKMQSILLITLTVLFVSDVFKVAHSSKLSNSRLAKQLLIRCTANGLIPYPGGDTTRYIQCVWIASRGRWYYWVYNCPPGSGFDQARSLCVIGVTAVPTTTGAPDSTTGSMGTTAGTTAGTTGGTTGATTPSASMTTAVTTAGTTAGPDTTTISMTTTA